MLFAASFVACNNDDVNGNKGGNTDLTFNIEVAEVTKSNATFNITPSNLEADYLVVVLDAKAVESCANDKEIVNKIYDGVKIAAENAETTFEAYLIERVKRGALENHTVSSLVPATKYYLLAFGVDAQNNFAATSVVNKVEFETAGASATSCTFEIKYTVNLTTVALKVIPSNNEQLWHLINVPVEDYQAYTSADGEYGWTKEQYFQNYLNTEIETLKGEGMSNEEIGIKLFHKGMHTLNDSGLKAKTKYVAFAAAVDYVEDAAVVTSALKEVRFTSGAAAESNLTFDIDVYDVEHYSAQVRITPSDLNANYYYHIGFIDNNKKSMKPVDIANAAIYECVYYWDTTEYKYKMHDPVTGVVDFTGENKLELNIAETEYYIVAFSFEPNPTYGTVINEETGEYDTNPGNITSAPVYVSFKTAEQGNPMTAEFTFKASDVGPYDFYLEIDAEDPSIYYQPGIAYADNFDPEAVLAQSSGGLAQLKQMTMEGQSPCLTFWEALEERLQSYYRNGDGKYYIANLEPEREYIGYVLAIDAHTGTFARCVYSEVIAKTTPIGKVSPEIEVLGVYNGEDENGQVFGNKELTKDYAIVAINFKNIDGATALYSVISPDPEADTKGMSDRYIISEFRGYWAELKSLQVPYEFYIAEWDVEQTIFAYAQDADGHEAHVARLGIIPITPCPIEELIEYYNDVNNATPAALAKSMVIAECAEPAMECIWSEAVGAPRAAEVTYHEVEPLKSIESDLVRVKGVKSVRF